jgi:cardiolipin-specific phospholipase
MSVVTELSLKDKEALVAEAESEMIKAEGTVPGGDSLVSQYFLQPLSSVYQTLIGSYQKDRPDPTQVRASIAEWKILRRVSSFDIKSSSSFLEGHVTEELLNKAITAVSNDQKEFSDAVDDNNHLNKSKAYSKTEKVYLDKDRYIQTFLMDTDGDRDFSSVPVGKKVIVLTHGFGSGLGFYFKTFEELSKVPGWRVYGIDWLGQGASARHPLPKKVENEDEDVQNVEAYFIDSLEQWRLKMGISKMTLVGHSLGGYLSAAYSLKYSENVERLILISPAGVPHMKLSREEFIERFSGSQKHLVRFASYLWDKDATPQAFIRTSGILGRHFVSKYSTRKFSHLGDDVVVDFSEYIHSISSLDGAGEFSLTRLLQPMGWAKKPLEYRLPALKMPVDFYYGEVDWMDSSTPKKMHEKGCFKEGSKVVIVPDAGHQVFLDNPDTFNDCLVDYMRKRETQ